MNQHLVDEFIKYADQIKYDIDNNDNMQQNIKNSFRLQAIKKIIDIINKFPAKITNSKQLKNIKGIGKKSLIHIDNILSTEKIDGINNIADKSYLTYVDALTKTYGIGHKTALKLFKKYKIKSISELKQLVSSGKISLPDNITIGLKYYGSAVENIPRSEMDLINIYLHKILQTIDFNLRGILCGSYRREKPTSNDIDMLIIHPDIVSKNDLAESKINYLSLFVKTLIKKHFIVDSLTSTNVPTKYMGLCKLKDNPVRRIDIRFVPYESYYTELLYFTGSATLNKKMRYIAEKKQFKLNEYGLFNNNIIFKVKSEKDIFDLLDMDYIAPEYR